ncbi:shikimate dehydrogenase [Lutispora thermophila]|uniref:Shikimate dehydrogenase (NADP(+)) n=1 Tax=Lutispora thermophila DSM 19022 TaxID=1122184 RepID=A0A1M6GDZ6_9FIRM|nr:shikimate dehydrogenase [Lutispora thermophila]SHJ08144.1 shikimate dehydrogenase [Lutispora thermophila DSM 19022]
MRRVDSKTKYIGLLGYPLGHSISPIMQNAAFENKNMNNLYIPIEVRKEDLGQVVRAMPKMNFRGFNVTIPHKIEVMSYLDEIDDLAKSIGAVNTVLIKDGRLKGYNTDGIGFLRSLGYELKLSVDGKNIFILGSGGAARAISMTLAMNMANRLYICNRTYEKAESLVKDINSKYGNVAVAIPLVEEKMEEAIKDAEILINTTSVGTYPDVDDIPINKALLHSKLAVCDVVYNPRKTKLLQEAEKLGCKTMSGLGMLIYQGEEAFEIWTGVKAPVETMFEAAEAFFNHSA